MSQEQNSGSAAYAAVVSSLPAWLRPGISLRPASAPVSDAALIEVARLSQLAPEDALQQMRSVQAGLTPSEVAARLRTVGRNEIVREARQTILNEIVSRAINPLNLLLLFLSVASVFAGDQRAAVVIVVMVVLSISLGFIQEHRSSNAAAALRRMVQNKATVVRSGGSASQGNRDVPIGEVVPGDIVLLSAGDMIPADVRLLTAKDLFVNQSALTGEGKIGRASCRERVCYPV